MKAKLMKQFEAAFGASEVAAKDLQSVYSSWLDWQVSALSGLPKDMQIDVLDGLVADRCKEIAAAAPADKGDELAYDRCWVRVWPLDREAESFARKVVGGMKLTPTEEERVRIVLTQLQALARDTSVMKFESKQAFAEILSEAQLDAGFALAKGRNCPISRRLGQTNH